MGFRRKKQLERKQRKKKLTDKLNSTLSSMQFLKEQKQNLEKLPISKEEKEIQIQLIERSISLETRNIEELENILDEVSGKVNDF